MANTFGNETRRNNLRFMSARDATQLAITKWERLAFGVDKATDPAIRDLAISIYHSLREVAERANTSART